MELTTARTPQKARSQADPPIQLAHVFFVLWVDGSVDWGLCAARLAQGLKWLVLKPVLAAILVLAPPILAHVPANYLIRMSGTPRFH